MKYLTFRFDVDTHKCVQEGIPNLIGLGVKHKVNFTFFVNFGRSIDQASFLNAYLHPEKHDEKHDNLSAFYKLGVKDYFIAALLNPEVGNSGKDILKKLLKEGHEIGLHGGSNHELWNREALYWSKKRISEEIIWGVNKMKIIDPEYKMIGFAAPHWKGNNKIYEVLKENEFLYVSDIHTDKPLQKVSKKGPLPNVPMNIGGEPGGVGYLEYCRAKKMNDKEILSDFRYKLGKRTHFACVYDHPYYSGVKELKLLSEMIEIGKELGFKIIPLNKIYKNL